MTLSARLLFRPLLALALVAFCAGGAGAAAPFGLKVPSATGSYLAGNQALNDLRTEDAARFFRGALSNEWDNPILAERGFVAFAANGDIEESATAARHLLELSSQNDLAKLVIATEALRERRYGAAVKALDDLGTDSFAGITGGILRAWAFVGDGKPDDAFAELDSLGKDGLEDFLVFHRALMYEASGQQQKALEFARKAHEVDPLVARIVEAYARMLGNAGRFDDASAVISDFEAQGYTHPLVDVVKAAIAKKQRPGPFTTSVQVGAAEMFNGIGVALARDGSSDVALVFLRLGLYLDPNADVIALVLGQLLDAADQHTAANAIYDRIPATSPMKPTAVVRVAENLDAMGDRDEALRRLGNIVRANPGDIDALSVLGDLQRAAKLYADAAETYSKALALTPDNAPGDWRFFYVRGIANERNKQWPKAEADFKEALRLNPDQPQVLNYLGYSWVDQGMNLDEALGLIQKAVDAAPNDGYIIDSLGWAYYRLGRFDEAVATLEQAVQLRPDDPEINDHLGDAYWRIGRQLEAKFQWSVAQSVDEEGTVSARVKAKLAGGLDAAPATAGDDTPAEEAPASESSAAVAQ